MQSNLKCFYKKTRKHGKIIKIIEEKYLHDDIECGYRCYSATDISTIPGLAIGNDDKTYHVITVDTLKQMISQSPHKQLLVIDTNIALHQMDVLEYHSPITSLVLVMQTVLQELKHLNKSIFRRLIDLIKNTSKSFLFYPNEHSKHTVANRIIDETANDANDRAIVTAANYFKNILMDHADGEVVFITNDFANMNRATAHGLRSMSMRQYVELYVSQYPELLDLVANDTNDNRDNDVADRTCLMEQDVYPAHLPMTEILQGLKNRKYLKGVIRCQHRDNPFDCYVIVRLTVNRQSIQKSVLIKGFLHTNRAVNGDLVAIELLESTVLSSSSSSVITTSATGVAIENESTIHDHNSSSYPVSDNLEELNVALETAEPSMIDLEGLPVSNKKSSEWECYNGRVVGIIKRNWRQYAGSLDVIIANETITKNDAKANNNSSNSEQLYASLQLQFVPLDKSIPRILITTRRMEELIGQRLLVSIDQWPANSQYPLGHYLRVLGKEGDKAVETQVILHEFDVPHAEFSPAVMACLPPPGWTITPEIISQRTDLRHIPVVSIDPPGCKDIDDALHCIRLPNGRLEAGVHIADVTYFVHPDTPIDKEAAHRSTSTYLVDRRLDMLPGLLTTQLCSLRSKEDHLAFSVIFEMDENAHIYDVRFCKSVIHSVASLTYDEAQAMLDSPQSTSLLTTATATATATTTSNQEAVHLSVNLLNKLARILRRNRIDMGALTLASPEVRFKLDSETQNPTDVTMYALKESNALVEEWMLLANITVSKQILRFYPTLAILRRHQPPSKQQFAPLLSAAMAVNVSLDITSSKTLADSLDKAVRTDDIYFNKLLRILSTRCMMPAQYFCSGELPKDQWHHYGLAAPVYTHFTSPIRRYADVLVHRLLSASLGVISLPAANSDHIKQQELCSHMNRRHRAAQYVSRASINNHTLLYFSEHPSVETAYVLSINTERFSFLIPRFGIEGHIFWDIIKSELDIIDIDDFDFDPIAHRIKLLKIQNVNKSIKSSELKNISQGSKTCIFEMQVFEQIKVSIKVKTNTSDGERKLVFQLIHHYHQPPQSTISNSEDNVTEQLTVAVTGKRKL